MLEEVRIRGLGVIGDAAFELAPGLTVFTGETGAGKTMVVSGLGLLLGGRADPGLVRTDARQAVVEGRVGVDADGPVAARAVEAGAELDAGALLLSRTVSAEGRSRAHLGGRAVPAGLLAELGAELVAVHGQSDQHQLRRPGHQRGALDRFAGAELAESLRVYGDAYARLRRLRSELAALEAAAGERAREAELLRLALAEIAAVDPAPGEGGALEREEARLAHADALRQAAGNARQALTGGSDDSALTAGDALSLLERARKTLDGVREHDPDLAAIADRLAESTYLVIDASAELASYGAAVESDPGRLAEVSQRRALVRGLTRKYGDSVEQVLHWAATASQRVVHLDGDDERVAVLRIEEEDLRTRLAEAAGRLSALRRAAAERFAAAVTAELGGLAMPQARVEVAVTQTPDPDGLDLGRGAVRGANPDGVNVQGPLGYGPHGVDEVEIRFAAHPGSPARPLDRAASGGELSRVMLAVEVVFAGADPVPTFVFDEVDAGVGGKAAVEVGRRLARLARTAQVVVVTHLPQVAAFADRHLVVLRDDEGQVTSSGVRAVEGSDRVRELSRMLAGLEGSASAQAHAEELLAEAATRRAR